MPHDLTYLVQTKLVPGLYWHLRAGLTSSWMDGNAVGVEYRGGKYIMMTTMETDGLGDYDRELGYPRGLVQGAKMQYELTMDRGREFLIDVADNDETGFLLSAANVMTSFQRDWVIPEIDSFRYAKLYQDIVTNNPGAVSSINVPAASITDTLADDIADIEDKVGAMPFVIIMSGKTRKFFGREFIRQLDYTTLGTGQFRTQVNSLDGHPLVVVPSARLKTEYEFFNGISTGQEIGGFAPTAGAQDILWMIIPAGGPMPVAKIDTMRVFDPMTFQDAHAWKVDYRIFHDIWVFPNAYNFSFIRTGSIV